MTQATRKGWVGASPGNHRNYKFGKEEKIKGIGSNYSKGVYTRIGNLVQNRSQNLVYVVSWIN